MRNNKKLTFWLILGLVLFSSVAKRDEPEDDDDDDEEDYGWGGNITLPEQHLDQWNYRKTSVEAVDDDTLGFRWTSEGVSGHQNQHRFDYIVGAAFVGTDEAPPTNYVSYFDASAVADNRTRDFNISYSSGFIANAYTSLYEKHPNGSVAREIKLESLNWSLSKFYSKDGLFVTSVKGNSTQLGLFHCYFTFVVSSVVGRLNSSDEALISPKSLETIVQIMDYPYLAAENSLSLELVIGSGDATISVNDSYVFYKVGNVPENTVYFVLTTKVMVDEKEANCSISQFQKSRSVHDAFENDDYLEDVIEEVYEARAQAYHVNITFPAGARVIHYDPTTGAGVPIQEATLTPRAESSRFQLWLIAVIIAAVAIVIAVIILAVLFSRRSKYSSLS